MHTVESNAFFTTGFSRRRVMVILRGNDPAETVRLAQRAWDAGIALVEVPLQSTEAASAISELARWANGTDRVVGAGTITSLALAEEARDVGAAFTVAPGYDPEVVASSLDHGMPHLPGVGTATEVQRATASGLAWVKAFPADALGSRWVAGMLGPFPSLNIVATGGVGAANAREFLDAGAGAVSLGTSFAELSEAEVEALR